MAKGKMTRNEQQITELLNLLTLAELELALKKAQELLAEQTREERALSLKSAG